MPEVRTATPRLVATDLDGTLLRSDGSLSSASRAVLAALDEQGVHVVLVTARPRRWMDDLWPVVGSHGLAVVSNGALTWDVAAARPVEVRPFDPAVGRAVVTRVAAAAPGAGFGVERVSGLVCDRAYVEVEDPPVGRVVDDPGDLWDEPGLKLLVQDAAADPETLRSAVTDAVGDDAVATWTLPGLIEVSAQGVTKAVAVAHLAEGLGIGPEEVVAFGDMPNDVPMLTWAGRGYAVAGAHPEVRAAADEVVGGNDEDGVARALVGLFGLPSAVMGAC